MQEKINQLMTEFYITFEELATRLGVSKQTLTRKLRGTTDFTYPEMMLLTQIFNIENPEEFFFGQ